MRDDGADPTGSGFEEPLESEDIEWELTCSAREACSAMAVGDAALRVRTAWAPGAEPWRPGHGSAALR